MTENHINDSKGLGLVIYTERMHITPAVTYTLLGFIFMIFGVLSSFVKNPNPQAPPFAMLILGYVIAIFGGLCLMIGLVRLIPNLSASWYLHQSGVRLLKGSKERILRYEEIDELTLKVVRVFFHGACTGEVHEVTFKSHTPDKPVIYLKQVRRPRKMSGTDLDQPSELAQVCDRIAALIAHKIAARIQRGESVPWVPRLCIRPDGLEIGSAGEKAEWIDWKQIDRVGIEQGVFQLWRNGEPQPVIKIPTYFPNFFPGYLVILHRTGQACPA